MVLLVVLFVLIAKRTGRGGGAVVPAVIAATGFAGMAADLIVIFAFQSLYGYVYQWIVLLITAFMAGLALGGWLTNRRPAGEGRRALIALEVALVLFWILLPLVLSVVHSRLALPWVSTSAQVLLFLLNAVSGFLVGAQFPLANQIWLTGREAQRGTTGMLYASDLVGAFAAALLVSVALMPVLGIVATCALVAILKLGSLAVSVALIPRD
jgi:spermidine synthase